MSRSIALSRRNFIIMPLCVAGLSACKVRDQIVKLSGLTMGTSYSLTVVDAPRAVSQTDIQTAVNTALTTVNQQMSNWDSTSEISRFNADQSMAAKAV